MKLNFFDKWLQRCRIFLNDELLVSFLIVVINESLKMWRSLLVQLVLSTAQHSHPSLTLSFSVPNLPYSLVSKVITIFVSFSILQQIISFSLWESIFFFLHFSNLLFQVLWWCFCIISFLDFSWDRLCPRFRRFLFSFITKKQLQKQSYNIIFCLSLSLSLSLWMFVVIVSFGLVNFWATEVGRRLSLCTLEID
jgi:hypothetical protein